MKTQILIAILLAASFTINAQKQTVKDTTIIFNEKKIQVSDSADQVKVQVYKMDTTVTMYKQIYEGIFTNEKSFERWTVSESIGINLPFSKNTGGNSRMEIHSDDFRLGLVYLNNRFDFGDDGGLMVMSANEFNYQPVLAIKRFEKQGMAFSTGIGMTWRNYHIGGNQNLVVNNGITSIGSAPEGIKYTYSRLRTFELNVPLMYEWQPKSMSGFYLSTGVIFGVNVFTSYKVKYRNPDTNKKTKEVLGKQYQINPFSFSGLVQAGYKDIGVYFKYTPTSVFKKEKGPEVQTISVGLSLAL